MTSRNSGRTSRSLCLLSPTLTCICRDFCWRQPSSTNPDKAKSPSGTLRCFCKPCEASQASGWLCRPFTPDRYLAIADQTMDTLFPFLREQRPYLLSQAQASPFSGSATPALALAPPGNKNKKGKNNGGRNQNRRDKRRQYGNGPSWGPNGSTALAAGSSSSAALTPEHAVALTEITRLQAMLAGYMGHSPSYSAYNELPVPPTIPAYTSLSTEGRIRPYYCWLHGHTMASAVKSWQPIRRILGP